MFNFYKNYSEEDLIIAYFEHIEHANKIPSDLTEIIESKYGFENFLEIIEKRKEVKKEISMVSKEIFNLSGDGVNIEFVKNHITSNLLSSKELENLIDSIYYQKQKEIQDKKINTSLIFSCLVGIIASSFICGLALSILLFYFPIPILLLIVPVYFLCYKIIQLITKKTRNNALIFISCIIATILSYFQVFAFLKIFNLYRL